MKGSAFSSVMDSKGLSSAWNDLTRSSIICQNTIKTSGCSPKDAFATHSLLLAKQTRCLSKY